MSADVVMPSARAGNNLAESTGARIGRILGF